MLTDWGLCQIERRAHEVRAAGDGDVLLAYRGSGNAESRRGHSSQALRETLERAGLTGDAYVRPASLAAWAGVQVMCQTGRIDVVARALGVRSLDAAARMIGWDWTTSDFDG